MLIEAIEVNAVYEYRGHGREIGYGEHGVAIGFRKGVREPWVLFAVQYYALDKTTIYEVRASALIPADERCVCDTCSDNRHLRLAERARELLTDNGVQFAATLRDACPVSEDDLAYFVVG